MKLLFLGNSHIAALRDAYGQFAGDWPGVEMQFVGGHKDHLADTAVEDGVLTPLSADTAAVLANFGGSQAGVDLRRTDAVIVVGCQVAMSRAAALYRSARWAGLPTARDGVPDGCALVSEPCFGAMLQTALVGNLGARLLRILARGTEVPLYLTSQPRTTTGILGRKNHALSVLNDLVANGDGTAVSAMFDNHATTLCRALGGTFLPQPPQTIDRDVLTARAFTEGAIRLTAKGRAQQPADDLLHANAAYGRIVISQVVAAVGATAG